MRRPGRRLISRNLPPVISPRTAMMVRRALLRWFDAYGRAFPWRQEGTSLYQVIVAELLLQRTKAETVAAFFNTFISRFGSWESIAKSTVDDIGEVLKPIGLWRRRAASLFALATEMADRRGRFPRKRAEVEGLPGVGQYIANSILLFSAGRPEPLLDVNMARVLERLCGPRKLVDIRDDPHLQSIARSLVRGKRAGSINWAILDLAATICTTKNPRCQQCPIGPSCQYANHRCEKDTAAALAPPSTPAGQRLAEDPHVTRRAAPGLIATSRLRY